MNSFSSHSNGKVNLLELKEWLRKEFLTIFEECSGKKLIIWDNSLTGPIGLISEYTVLKERGVEKMLDLKQIELLKMKDICDFAHIFFIVKPKLELMELISHHILNIEKEKKNNLLKDFHIVFVPRKSMICERKLQDLRVYGTFKDNIREFALDLIPLEYDLLSMENPDFYKNCFLYNDHTQLYHIAKSIMTLQNIYGIVPIMKGVGKYSKMVADMVLNMRKEYSKDNDYYECHVAKIDTIILIDRTFDLVTPFLTQLTYEGLIDENFTIRLTQIEIPQNNQKNQNDNSIIDSKRNFVTLNSSDSLYAEIRDKNYNGVSSALSRTAKELQHAYELKNQLKSTSDMRMYVEKTLKMYQTKKTSLANHTAIAGIIKDVTENDDFIDQIKCEQELVRCYDVEKINSEIYSYISKRKDIYKVLRLICIHCYVCSGFKPKILEMYKREIIRAYGFKYIELFNNLQDIGLIFLHQNKFYPNISKIFRLIVDDVNEQDPNDISYVYSGYAPLSVRLCQFANKQTWKSISEIAESLPNENVFFEEYQNIQQHLANKRSSILSSFTSQIIPSTEQKTIMVFFIGGCTYAEISAIRFISQTEDASNDYIIGTTNIINGTSLLKNLNE